MALIVSGKKVAANREVAYSWCFCGGMRGKRGPETLLFCGGVVEYRPGGSGASDRSNGSRQAVSLMVHGATGPSPSLLDAVERSLPASVTKEVEELMDG
jgi:hypothetical protein